VSSTLFAGKKSDVPFRRASRQQVNGGMLLQCIEISGSVSAFVQSVDLGANN